MGQYNEQLRDAVVAYLRAEFPEFDINEQSEEESYCFHLSRESTKHFLRVMYSATENVSADELTEQLEQYAVASTMRGLGDFPVVVTEQGCMFGSP